MSSIATSWNNTNVSSLLIFKSLKVIILVSWIFSLKKGEAKADRDMVAVSDSGKCDFSKGCWVRRSLLCHLSFTSYIILTFPLRVYSISNSFLCLVYERGQFIFLFPYGYQIVPSLFQEDFLSPLNRIGTFVETNGLYKYGSISWLYSDVSSVLLAFYDCIHSSWQTRLKFQISLLHQWFQFHQVLESSYLENAQD